jgi:hypothetical protein
MTLIVSWIPKCEMCLDKLGSQGESTLARCVGDSSIVEPATVRGDPIGEEAES